MIERKHKYLIETACASSFQSNLPSEFWGDSVLYAAYLLNRLPLTVLGSIAPYEKFLVMLLIIPILKHMIDYVMFL